MPEGRFVSRSISASEQLATVSFEADYLFGRCIPHLDRDGRMTGHPGLVKATVCPLRPEITSDTIPDLLRQLSRAGLLRWYEADGKQVLEFPGFRAHQRGMKAEREAPSRYMPFGSNGSQDLCGNDSGSTPDGVRTSSAEGKSSLR